MPLAGGRPQTSFVDASQIKYFSALLGSSAEDLRVALTVLSGRAELYVGDDLACLPRANDSSTYRYTTHGREHKSSSLVIPGPHRNRTRFAIGVEGLEDGTVFSISASFSQQPILLQEGVPLQQTVSAGRNEFFVYRVASHEDIVVTVTALQGGESKVKGVDVMWRAILSYMVLESRTVTDKITLTIPTDPDILASTSTTDRPACKRAPGADPWSFEVRALSFCALISHPTNKTNTHQSIHTTTPISAGTTPGSRSPTPATSSSSSTTRPARRWAARASTPTAAARRTRWPWASSYT